MLEAERAAVVAGEVVVRQPGAGQLAAHRAREVAELGAQHRAAPSQQTWRQRQVVVRSEVDVVRRGDVEAAVLRAADAREEETGTPALVDREAGIREIQQRHRADHQRGVARRADAFGLVQVDARGAQLPAFVSRIAGRVGHLAQYRGIAFDLRAGGAAVAARLQQLVAHLLERIAILGQLALGAGRAQQQATILVMHVAFGFVAFGFAVVTQQVGRDELVGAADLDPALEQDALLVADVEARRAQLGRARFALAVFRQIGPVELEQRIGPAQRPHRGIVSVAVGGDGRQAEGQQGEGRQGEGQGQRSQLRHGREDGQNGRQHAVKRRKAATQAECAGWGGIHPSAFRFVRERVPFQSVLTGRCPCSASPASPITRRSC